MAFDMVRRTFVRAALAAMLSGCAIPEVKSSLRDTPPSLIEAEPLVGQLNKAVPGLSHAQTVLGAGSLLRLAKAKMPEEEYSTVGDALPGSAALIKEAEKQGAPKEPSSLSEVTSFLGKSGISPEQVNQLVPALGGALQGKVPDGLSSSFLSALR